MNIKKRYKIVLMVFCVLSNAAGVFAATQAQYNSFPTFLSFGDIPPNVMFMLDNSGSMKQSLSTEIIFDSSKLYYGPFEENKKYKYDNSILLNPNAYTGVPYQVTVSAPSGAFVEDNSNCTIGLGNNCWDGNYLNWLVTRKIDAARKVMVGGKVESRAAYDYIPGGNLEWKIVLQNEPADRSMSRIDSSSHIYTPYPANTRFSIDSLAGNVQAPYMPYSTMSVATNASATIIYDQNGNIIGEYGTVSNCNANENNDSWCKVDFINQYTVAPVVVALPLSHNNRDKAVSRINSVNANSFSIRIERWRYGNRSGSGSEDISYLVIKKGIHDLGGKTILAYTAVISSLDSQIQFVGANYTNSPVVFSSITTNNNLKTVTTRHKDLSTTEVKIKLQKISGAGSLNTETVSYIALEKGIYGDGVGTSFEVGVREGQNGVDKNFQTIQFTYTGTTPSFLACIQTTNDNDECNLRYNNLTTNSVDVGLQERQNQNHQKEDVGYAIIYPATTIKYNLALIVEEEPKGLMHDIYDKVRLGISFYNYDKDSSNIYDHEKYQGGTMKLRIPLNPFVDEPLVNGGYRMIETPIDTELHDIIDAIEHYPLIWGTTPLAENYYEIIRYFQQIPSYYSTINNDNDYYNIDNTWDPYYFNDSNGDGVENDPGLISCAVSYVLVFTDGEPYSDDYLPCYNSNSDEYDPATTIYSECMDYDGNNKAEESTSYIIDSNDYDNALDDLALWAKSVVDQSTYNITGDRDLRSDAGMDGNQNLFTYTVGFGSNIIPQLLIDTAEHGGGKSYAAEDGRELKNNLTDAFTDILLHSSGTSASVISNTRSGEGAIYQSIFFPRLTDSTNKISWVGQIHALLVDAFGNIREDTNKNYTLDLASDRFIVFNENETANRYTDVDENQRLELDTATCPKDQFNSCLDKFVDTVKLNELNYLWNTSDWLNEISDSSVESQRFYTAGAAERYIFTWIDADGNGIVDSGETMDFATLSTAPSDAQLTDTALIYPYLHLYSSFQDRPSAIDNMSDPTLNAFLKVQTDRQINYIRGSDCVDPNNALDCNTQQVNILGFPADNTEMRSRQFDYDQDGTIETWRLGDIIYSTPTLVGRPSENFHLLYHDSSYAPFAAKYQKRRQVVYTGANDGMVHAFNAGFYDPNSNRFCRSSDFTNETTCQATSELELGAELWAYVPFNLLPHLYWLTEPSYDKSKHTSYIDQKPRIFDAKIFIEESECSDALTSNDDSCFHPGGWGTVMVIGMNFGGGSIIADIDKTDGSSPMTGVDPDPTMKSAFMIFDITNPEAAPELMAEVVMPRMGFATSYPTVAVIKDGNLDGIYGDYSSGENKWYLAFGSGPADSSGNPGYVNSTNGEYDNEILYDVKSLQDGQFYLLDLVQLASYNQLYTLDNSGALFQGLKAYADNYDSNTFITKPISVDFELDFNTDALYFGTIEGSPPDPNNPTTGWGGKLRRIVIDNQNNPPLSNSVLFDAGRPISAAPAIGQDSAGTHWVFFGTGRYLSSNDKTDTSQQSFYGLKEEVDSSGSKTWTTLLTSDLTDVTNYQVYSDQSVIGAGVPTDWDSLRVDQLSTKGWMLDFSTNTGGERNLGQAALAGGLLAFTTFIPDSEICSSSGESYFWALFYETGTAHYSSVLGVTLDNLGEMATKKISLGQGMATSPSIHVGSEEGSKAFIQTSTGSIKVIDQINPVGLKSSVLSWEEQ